MLICTRSKRILNKCQIIILSLMHNSTAVNGRIACLIEICVRLTIPVWSFTVDIRNTYISKWHLIARCCFCRCREAVVYIWMERHIKTKKICCWLCLINCPVLNNASTVIHSASIEIHIIASCNRINIYHTCNAVALFLTKIIYIILTAKTTRLLCWK